MKELVLRGHLSYHFCTSTHIFAIFVISLFLCGGTVIVSALTYAENGATYGPTGRENLQIPLFEEITIGFKELGEPQYTTVNTTDFVIRDVLSRINLTTIDRIDGQDRVLIPVYIKTQDSLTGKPEWRVFHYVWKENPQHYDVEAIVGVMPMDEQNYRVEVGKLTSRAIKVTVDGNQSGTIPADSPLGRISPGHILFSIPRITK
jgi:hypothetical protein